MSLYKKAKDIKSLKNAFVKLPKFLQNYIFFMNGYIPFLKDFRKFSELNKEDKRFNAKWSERYPSVLDRTKNTDFNRHYVYHTSWAARKVKEINPEYHVDVSSSLYFAGILSSFIPVHFYDYRPAELVLDNFTSKAGDLLNLPFEDNSVKCLSCMHVVEHVGLGRYGDPLDPKGDIKAMNELKRVIAKGGYLLFVVPMGKPNIEYNSHRIYSLSMIKEYFSDMILEEFMFIPESEGPMIKDASEEVVLKDKFACGCFLFKKQ